MTLGPHDPHRPLPAEFRNVEKDWAVDNEIKRNAKPRTTFRQVANNAKDGSKAVALEICSANETLPRVPALVPWIGPNCLTDDSCHNLRRHHCVS